MVGIDPKTLRKYYREELDLGETKANAQVAGFLFNAAKNGNVTAQIFWLKTRARWRETPMELRHSGVHREEGPERTYRRGVDGTLSTLSRDIDLSADEDIKGNARIAVTATRNVLRLTPKA